MSARIEGTRPRRNSRRQSLSASAIASPAVQDIGGIGINQHGESIAKTIRLAVNQNGAFVPNATAQHTSQAQQGATAANFATFASAVADDFTVGTQNSFQERNGAQNRLPSITVGHKTLSIKLAVYRRSGKCLIVQEAEE